MKDKNIGFIGIGNVGCKIANNILNEGFNLYIGISNIDWKNGNFDPSNPDPQLLKDIDILLDESSD